MTEIKLGSPTFATVVEGVLMKPFDDMGLPQDTSVYAKKDCKTCYGRGVRRECIPKNTVDKKKLRAVMQSDPTARFRSDVSGKHMVQVQACPCAQERYQIARKELTAAINAHKQWLPHDADTQSVAMQKFRFVMARVDDASKVDTL